LQWKDVDWLAKTVTLVRGVVKQDVDDVKTEDSARTMPLADGVIAVLTRWKQVSEFTRPDDWMFASPWKLGRQPVCYSWIWENLSIAGKAAGIGHLSSHAFRNAYRTWLDAMGTPVGVQQKMMRHADIRTTMNHYGTALKADMRKASDAVGRVSAGFKAS
jgi:integrase